MRIFDRCSRVLVIFTVMSGVAFGWGRTGHRVINGSFEKFLPAALQPLAGQTAYFVDHASDADSRKSSDPTEGPKHFIDIDYYPEFALGTLPHNYDSLCAEYGSATVIDNGTLPWAISSAYNMLVVYMENQDWDNAYRIIADLGHYVGDAFQPLHCTQNYDGRMTGNSGIHSRFESDLLDAYVDSVQVEGGMAAGPDTTALEFAFSVIGKSNSGVQEILDADSYARGIDPHHGTKYYEVMWSKLGRLMNEQLRGASEALASLVYSAWLDAGSPSLVSSVRPAVAYSFRVSDLYPNPFNPLTNFSVTLPTGTRPVIAAVSVFLPDGRLVRSEMRKLLPGTNVLSVDFTRFASGVYFIVLDMESQGRRQRVGMKAVLLK